MRPAGGGKESRGYTYAGSNDIDKVAWWDDNSGGETHPVGQKQPNGLGIYDMSGNVWEWCWDWYDDYPSGMVTDPSGPSTGSFRVIRGGSCYTNASLCRSANRNNSYRVGQLLQHRVQAGPVSVQVYTAETLINRLMNRK